MRTDVDVAIVGAGPAGAAAARHLARSGTRVLLLERSGFDAPRVGESLAPSINPLLRQLGVWPRFTALAATPSYGTRSSWGATDPQTHSHLVSPYGTGWHVDRARFDRMLADAAADAGADLRRATARIAVDGPDAGRWLLSVCQGGGAVQRVRARVLVDATGRRAHIGRRLGAERILLDRLVGVATLFVADVAEQGYVLVEAGRHGWWYSAPVPPNRMIAMFMTDGDICRRYAISSSQPWRDLLTGAPATAARVRGAPVWGPRVFPATSQRLHRTEHDAPWIAVGDAALAVDPISGSGVVRALRSGQAAAATAHALLGGDARPAIAAHETDRDLEWSSYLRERTLYYGAEDRWADAPFWRRRAAGAAGLPPPRRAGRRPQPEPEPAMRTTRR